MTKTKVALVGVIALFLIASLYLLQAQDNSGYYLTRNTDQNGTAKLADGSVKVKFEGRSFNRATNIRIIVTPVGSWSGIYVKDVSNSGFTVVSETGNPNAEFNWIAIAETKEPATNIDRNFIPQYDE